MKYILLAPNHGFGKFVRAAFRTDNKIVFHCFGDSLTVEMFNGYTVSDNDKVFEIDVFFEHTSDAIIHFYVNDKYVSYHVSSKAYDAIVEALRKAGIEVEEE